MAEVHNDIIDSVVHIIDTCAERGAFRGKELQGVGNIRTALQELKRRDIEEGEQMAQQQAMAATQAQAEMAMATLPAVEEKAKPVPKRAAKKKADGTSDWEDGDYK
jgi:hypothetical protein